MILYYLVESTTLPASASNLALPPPPPPSLHLKQKLYWKGALNSSRKLYNYGN